VSYSRKQHVPSESCKPLPTHDYISWGDFRGTPGTLLTDMYDNRNENIDK